MTSAKEGSMASTYNGVVSNERWENLRRPAEDEDEINVGKTERVISGLAAAAVVVVGLRRKRLRPFSPAGGRQSLFAGGYWALLDQSCPGEKFGPERPGEPGGECPPW